MDKEQNYSPYSIGEDPGYMQEAMLTKLRQQLVDQEQAARPGYATDHPSNMRKTQAMIMGGSNGESMNTSDPLVNLAERIGKLQGALRFNEGSLMPSNAGQMNADMQAQLAPLQALYGKLMSRMDQSSQAPRMQSSMGERDPSIPASREHAMMEFMKRFQMPQATYIDPYAKAREASIAAALRWLGGR